MCAFMCVFIGVLCVYLSSDGQSAGEFTLQEQLGKAGKQSQSKPRRGDMKDAQKKQQDIIDVIDVRLVCCTCTMSSKSGDRTVEFVDSSAAHNESKFPRWREQANLRIMAR